MLKMKFQYIKQVGKIKLNKLISYYMTCNIY